MGAGDAKPMDGRGMSAPGAGGREQRRERLPRNGLRHAVVA